MEPLVVGQLARYLPTGAVGHIRRKPKDEDMYLVRGLGWSVWAQRDELQAGQRSRGAVSK